MKLKLAQADETHPHPTVAKRARQQVVSSDSSIPVTVLELQQEHTKQQQQKQLRAVTVKREPDMKHLVAIAPRPSTMPLVVQQQQQTNSNFIIATAPMMDVEGEDEEAGRGTPSPVMTPLAPIDVIPAAPDDSNMFEESEDEEENFDPSTATTVAEDEGQERGLLQKASEQLSQLVSQEQEQDLGLCLGGLTQQHKTDNDEELRDLLHIPGELKKELESFNSTLDNWKSESCSSPGGSHFEFSCTDILH